nr:hypothetical protein [Tanacetum cinerariifolium]
VEGEIALVVGGAGHVGALHQHRGPHQRRAGIGLDVAAKRAARELHGPPAAAGAAARAHPHQPPRARGAAPGSQRPLQPGNRRPPLRERAHRGKPPPGAAPKVAQISAALQKQITRDFGPVWSIQATISPFQELHDVPPGYWPIIIRDDISNPDALGYHTDSNGQPFSLVLATAETSLTCSHECLEMLADPFGNRLIAADSLKPGQGRVLYLVEVCDPSEDSQFSYTVNGITVCDFYTPHFFDPIGNLATHYSFTGAIRKPLEIREGGYISWQLPATGEWWQLQNFGGGPNFVSINGQPKAGQSLREFIDSQMHTMH